MIKINELKLFHIYYNHVVVLELNSNEIFRFLYVVIYIDINLLQSLHIKFLERL